MLLIDTPFSSELPDHLVETSRYLKQHQSFPSFSLQSHQPTDSHALMKHYPYVDDVLLN